MSLNLISIILLLLLILSKNRFKGKKTALDKSFDYSYSLWIVILILSIRIVLQLLYSGSSWYFEPLMNGQYLVVYLWYEGPIFATLFIVPFYLLILKELQSKGLKQYTQCIFSGMKEKTIIGLKGVSWGLLLLIAYAVIAYATESIFFDQKEVLTPQAEDSFRESLLRFSESSLLYYLFLIDDIVLFPIAEELFFRGYCYTAVKRQTGVKWGIIISSLIFALYHQNIVAIIPYFLIGIVLSMVYERSKSLIPSFFIHLLYNATMLFIYSG